MNYNLKSPYVAIVNYGLGNIFSVKNACDHVGLISKITSRIDGDIKSGNIDQNKLITDAQKMIGSNGNLFGNLFNNMNFNQNMKNNFTNNQNTNDNVDNTTEPINKKEKKVKKTEKKVKKTVKK